MAHVLTDGEKTTQRLPKQWSKTFLAIPEYHTVFTARLNGVPGTPASDDMVAEINFDTPTGTLADVLPDMSLYISAVGFGSYDLGICRIRKDPISGTFYIGETSEVVWQDEAFLTVVDDFSLWQKSLRVVAEEVFMDWDVGYTDQHEDFDPVPAMGTHRVAKLANGTVDVTLGPSADTSAWVIDSTIASRAWVCAGSTLDDATAVNPVATFTAAGTYLAYCTFTAANGKTFIGVRYVIIYDDDNPLIENFLFNNGRGNFDGGYSFDVTLFSDFGISTLRKRSLVILCTEDYAENLPVTMPGQIAGAENILCVGRITNIDNSRTYEFGEISFNVESDEYWLRQIRDYPSGLELQNTATGAWTSMPSLNVDRALWHFLHWRSTATRVMDVQNTNDGRLATRLTTARANLWERLIQILGPTIFAGPHVDNFGRLWNFIEPQMLPVASRTWPVVMTITDSDIEGGVSWVRRDVTPISMLFFSGIAVDTSGGASSYFSMSPGHSYGHYGEEETQDNYLVTDQANSNELCGLYYGRKNNPIDNLEIQFAHSMRVLGLFPRQQFYYELSAVNDPRGIGFAGNLIPREVQFSQSTETGFISFSVLFEPESFPGPSVDGDVPTMEDEDFSDDEIINFPPIIFPDPIIVIPPVLENTNHPKKVVIASSKGVLYTEDFDVLSPTWYYMNNGMTQAQYSTLQNLIVTPSGALFVHTTFKVFGAVGLGGVWTEIADISDFNEGSITGIGLNPNQNEEIVITGSLHINTPGSPRGRFVFASMAGLGDGDGVNKMRMHTNQQGIAYAGNNWWVIGNADAFFLDATYWKFDSGGTLQNGELGTFCVGAPGAAPSVFLAPVGTQEIIYYWTASDTPGSWRAIVNGVGALEFTALTTIVPKSVQGIAPSPTGTIIMAGSWDEVNGYYVPYISTDSGATWSSLAGTIPVGPDCYENCRDENRFIIGGGTVIRLTLDLGLTYFDKSGNLSYIAALLDITNIRYIE